MTETLSPSLPDLSAPDVFTKRHEQSPLAADWLQESQRAAWAQFLELPTPVRTNEKWRFAKLNRLADIGRFQPALTDSEPDPSLTERSKRIQHVSGRISFVDDRCIGCSDMDPALTEQGVIFTSLSQAVQDHPDLVRSYFLKESPELGSEKYEALHLALLRDGVFLYIPDNVEVKAPFIVNYWAQQNNGAIFPHTLFVTGRNAAASLVEFQECVRPDTHHFVVANTHLHAGDGARPNHTMVQNWNLNTLSLQLNTNNAQRDTTATSTLINVGSIQARQEIHGKIFGSGSNVEMYALNVPKGEQEFDQRTLQSHIAPHSRSDLLFKNALMDSSRTIFSGLIIVEENAQQTDAYQTNNNLMISDDAEANSLPGLEIKANDVKCSHGATTGRIDQSELFYFLARGIPASKARELMVFGYFEEIIAKLDCTELADYVRELVQNKFSH